MCSSSADPEEAVAMGLEIEKVVKSGRKKGVASYVDPVWEKWLQECRVELNAMSTPQFIAWLEGKIQLYDKGKVIPPANIMQESLEHSLHDKLGQKIAEIPSPYRKLSQISDVAKGVSASAASFLYP